MGDSLPRQQWDVSNLSAWMVDHKVRFDSVPWFRYVSVAPVRLPRLCHSWRRVDFQTSTFTNKKTQRRQTRTNYGTGSMSAAVSAAMSWLTWMTHWVLDQNIHDQKKRQRLGSLTGLRTCFLRHRERGRNAVFSVQVGCWTQKTKNESENPTGYSKGEEGMSTTLRQPGMDGWMDSKETVVSNRFRVHVGFQAAWIAVLLASNCGAIATMRRTLRSSISVFMVC